MSKQSMEDVQMSPSQVAMAIDRVGVRDLRLPIVVRDRQKGAQHSVAQVDIGVDLPAEFKGTHMSRFVEALEGWSEDLHYDSMRNLLHDIKERLHARKAYALFRFPYFLVKQAPASGRGGLMDYQCKITGELEGDKPRFLLEIDVPVMTVCPCSKAISDEGAHSQRAIVRMRIRQRGFAWIEEFIEIAEASASSPVYSLLKREDEKFVTETAFANPTFVEDVVRAVAQKLESHPQVSWFHVEVESHESIHNHSAFASIEKHL